MLSTFLEYLKNEEGQTSTEYVLLIAVVAMIVFKFRKVATDKLIGMVNTVFGKAGELVERIDE